MAETEKFTPPSVENGQPPQLTPEQQVVIDRLTELTDEEQALRRDSESHGAGFAAKYEPVIQGLRMVYGENHQGLADRLMQLTQVLEVAIQTRMDAHKEDRDLAEVRSLKELAAQLDDAEKTAILAAFQEDYNHQLQVSAQRGMKSGMRIPLETALSGLIFDLQKKAKQASEKAAEASPATAPAPPVSPAAGPDVKAQPQPPITPETTAQPEIKQPELTVEQNEIEKKIQLLETELKKPAPTVQVIGDVHGDLANLDLILDPTADKYYFVGDLIDRGPNSLGVLQRLKELSEQTGSDGKPKAEFVLGNHEVFFLAAMEGDDRQFYNWVANGGEEVINQIDPTLIDGVFKDGVVDREKFNQIINNPVLQQWASWLRTHGQFSLVRDGSLIVHAGVPMNADGTLASAIDGKTGIDGLDAWNEALKSGVPMSQLAEIDTQQTPFWAGQRIRGSGYEWFQRVQDPSSVVTALNQQWIQRDAGVPIQRVVYGHTLTNGSVRNAGDQILGIDAMMSRAYSGQDGSGGSLYLDAQGVRFIKQQQDKAQPVIIDTRPRTIADTDRGYAIRKEIAQLRAQLIPLGEQPPLTYQSDEAAPAQPKAPETTPSAPEVITAEKMTLDQFVDAYLRGEGGSDSQQDKEYQQYQQNNRDAIENELRQRLRQEQAKKAPEPAASQPAPQGPYYQRNKELIEEQRMRELEQERAEQRKAARQESIPEASPAALRALEALLGQRIFGQESAPLPTRGEAAMTLATAIARGALAFTRKVGEWIGRMRERVSEPVLLTFEQQAYAMREAQLAHAEAQRQLGLRRLDHLRSWAFDLSTKIPAAYDRFPRLMQTIEGYRQQNVRIDEIVQIRDRAVAENAKIDDIWDNLQEYQALRQTIPDLERQVQSFVAQATDLAPTHPEAFQIRDQLINYLNSRQEVIQAHRTWRRPERPTTLPNGQPVNNEPVPSPSQPAAPDAQPPISPDSTANPDQQAGQPKPEKPSRNQPWPGGFRRRPRQPDATTPQEPAPSNENSRSNEAMTPLEARNLIYQIFLEPEMGNYYQQVVGQRRGNAVNLETNPAAAQLANDPNWRRLVQLGNATPDDPRFHEYAKNELEERARWLAGMIYNDGNSSIFREVTKQQRDFDECYAIAAALGITLEKIDPSSPQPPAPQAASPQPRRTGFSRRPNPAEAGQAAA